MSSFKNSPSYKIGYRDGVTDHHVTLQKEIMALRDQIVTLTDRIQTADGQITALTAALATARRDALREAAKMAWLNGWASLEEFDAAIRALANEAET